MKQNHDVIIIGSGIAGMTAAIYCLRAGLNVAIIEKSIYGGQMSITNEIEKNVQSFIDDKEFRKNILDFLKNLEYQFGYFYNTFIKNKG